MFFVPKKLFVLSLSGWVMAVLLAGCSLLPTPAPLAPPAPVSPTNVFSSRSEAEDGVLVETQGFSSGYIPGEPANFNFSVHNGSEVPLQSRYCLQLVSSEAVVATLANDQFLLQPGEGFGTVVEFTVPSNLTPGAYGLAFVVPGRTTSITTIEVGNAAGAQGGFWAEPQCP